MENNLKTSWCYGIFQALSTKPVCEEKLERRLDGLVKEIESLELKMESNARKLRWKLYEEWKEFQKR